MPTPARCWVISTRRAWPTAAWTRCSCAAAIATSSGPRAPTARPANSRSATSSAWSRCSNIWWPCPTAGSRRCLSPGTPARAPTAGSAGICFIPTRPSAPTTRCTGPVRTRTGTGCAPTATPPSSSGTTIRRPTDSTPPGPSSTWAAKPATGPAVATLTGAAAMPPPGRPTPRVAWRCCSMNARASSGGRMNSPACRHASRSAPASAS